MAHAVGAETGETVARYKPDDGAAALAARDATDPMSVRLPDIAVHYIAMSKDGEVIDYLREGSLGETMKALGRYRAARPDMQFSALSMTYYPDHRPAQAHRILENSSTDIHNPA